MAHCSVYLWRIFVLMLLRFIDLCPIGQKSTTDSPLSPLFSTKKYCRKPPTPVSNSWSCYHKKDGIEWDGACFFLSLSRSAKASTVCPPNRFLFPIRKLPD